jgi:hypothetical protein
MPILKMTTLLWPVSDRATAWTRGFSRLLALAHQTA